MSADKVVGFPKAETERPLKVIEKDYRACQHHHFDIECEQPKVFCRDCNEELDPHYVLRLIAGHHGQREYMIATLKREAEKLAKDVERQMKSRKKAELADRDRRELERLRRIAQANPDVFSGDIQIVESSTPRSRDD